MSRKGSVLGGALLVAGTSIGGGMLALPVLTSLAGFLPSLAIYLLCWLFMASTGLLFLEIIQWLPQDSNIVSMSDHTLGTPGRWFAWVVYMFLFYCLTVAYMVGCGNIMVEALNHAIPDWFGPLLFVLLFSPLILIQTNWAGRLNIGLMIGLILSYFAFVFIGYSSVDHRLLAHADWSKSLIALPIAFTSFAYQGIIPTLAAYLHHDAGKIRKAILVGSFIPFVAYVVWEWLILGIVPVFAPGGLAEALEKGQNAVQPLKNFIQNPAVYIVGQYFAFFALITSFLGVSLGLRDFLADGLQIRKDLKGKLLLAILVFIPPLLIAVMYPHIFLVALDYAGGFGCALLLGLLPILMVWVGRYSLNLKADVPFPGGKIILTLLAVFVLFEIFLEIGHLLNN